MDTLTRLTQPWLAVALAVAVLAALVWWTRRARPRGAVLAAHTERLRRLPRYRRLALRELVVSGAATVATLMLVAGAVLIAGRPTEPRIDERQLGGRDVMLCLDVSASMTRSNYEIMGSFLKIAQQLDGERIGLTLFSGAATTAFPLTDDYPTLALELERATDAFDEGSFAYVAGTETREPRASQIGDGLIGCLERFDEVSEERERAVVLASDNDPFGEEVFPLPEAAREAARRGVVVYGIGTPALTRQPERTAGFRTAVESTGGELFGLTGEDNADQVVSAINGLERARVRSSVQPVQRDAPGAAYALAGLGTTLLVLLVVVRRRG